MRLLVTRPEADAAPLAAALEARGHTVCLAPVISIVMKHEAAPDLAGVAALAFTSANGVRAFLPHVSAARQLPAFAVGPQTAAQLRAAGFETVRVASGDVVALAQTIAAAHPAGPVLHIAGRDQAGDLAGALASAGYETRRAVLYAAQAARQLPNAALTALRNQTIDGVVLYSKRSAEIFYRLADAAMLDMKHVPAYCLSEGVGDIAREFGAPVHVAAFPDDEHMIACLDT